MRTISFLTLTALLSFAAFSLPAQASDHPRIERCAGIEWRQSPAKVGRLIRCLARSFDAPGTPRYAAAIGWCESRWNPRAYGNGNAGVMQQRLAYWDGRYRTFGAPLGLRPNVYNAMTNITVSVRMAKSVGSWRDWSCA